MTACNWCDQEIPAPKRCGGREQAYCSPRCRRQAYDTKAAWVDRLMDSGLLTMAMLRAFAEERVSS